MLKIKNLKKFYGSGHTSIKVLDGVDAEFVSGEFVGIYGSSGSGKSTLLHLMGGLDRPSEGEVLLDDKNIFSFHDDRLSDFRNKTIGFVFQFYHLLPEFSAEENVMIPCFIAGLSRKEALKRSSKVLEKMQLYDRRKHKPSELSGGEQQRVAIARAIVMEPKMLLADEPTGNLDKTTGSEIMKVLVDLSKSDGMGIVMVTHDLSLTEVMDRKLELKDGRL